MYFKTFSDYSVYNSKLLAARILDPYWSDFSQTICKMAHRLEELFPRGICSAQSSHINEHANLCTIYNILFLR